MNKSSANILKKVLLKNGQVLIVRPPKIDDAEAIIQYLNIVGGESDNLLFGKDDLSITIEQEKALINNIDNNPNCLMILGIIDNTIVSISQISSPFRRRICHNSEIAISVRKDFWNIGVGSVMLKVIIDYAKTKGTIRNINLKVKASNTRAMYLYKKLGFKVVGIHKNYFNINGKYDDAVLMEQYVW